MRRVVIQVALIKLTSAKLTQIDQGICLDANPDFSSLKLKVPKALIGSGKFHRRRPSSLLVCPQFQTASLLKLFLPSVTKFQIHTEK